MSEIPEDLLYTEEHEYVKRTAESGVFQVGITAYAQGELGDIVYVDLPKVGDKFARMDVFGTVEAVKAVSDLYSPISGVVTEVNSALADDPAVVNNDPYGKGWMIKVRITDESETEQLLGPSEYAAHVGQ